MTNKIKQIGILVLIVLTFLVIIPLSQSFLFQDMKKGKLVINKEVSIPYLPKKTNKIMLLFFGYYGCSDVCSPILEDMNRLYDSPEFSKIKKNVDFYFINLIPNIEKFEADLFAKYFNQEFKGIYLSRSEIMKIDRGFNLYFAQSLQSEYEIDHTAHIYLIKKDKQKYLLKNSYTTTPLNEKQLLEDINVLVSPNDI